MLVSELLETCLKAAGFQVVLGRDGDDAIRILESRDTPSLRALVTDVDLGTVVNGWQVAHRARGLHPDIPVVYVTGGNADDWSANGVPNSILIPKPFAAAQVVTAVSQLLNTTSSPG